MTFSMPMYHDFVPQCVRPWIYVVLAFCFQFSNGMYLGAMNNVVGEWGVMREDVQMCLYATLTGMALYFPVLFRMKFRFTNRALLMTAAAVIVACNAVSMLRLPLPVLWAACVVCGMAKIQGTFECMSNIQLWMTPKRDFAVFFPLLHVVLLTSIEVSGFVAAWFAHEMHWTFMHWFIILLMLLVLVVQAVLTRPVHAMPKIVPLDGLDWFGAVLCLLVADGVAPVLRRLARLVVLAAAASGVRHGADNPCRVPATHGTPSASLLRTCHVELSLCGAGDIAHRRCRGTFLVRACA